MKKIIYAALLLTFIFTCSLANAHASPSQSIESKPIEETQEWQFKVLLDNREIGFHNFSVSQNGTRRRVETKAQFDVKLLFVNLFRYRHKTVENWDSNCLANINAATNANGKGFTVQGESEKEQFVVSDGKVKTFLPECIMTFAYWNPDFLKSSKLLNSQTGEYEPVKITQDGEDTVTVNGEVIPANRYLVDVKAGPITLWYSSDNLRWLALESVAKGGRTIRYEPMAIPVATNLLVNR